MAHISGMIDVPEGHPTVRVTARGTVLLNTDDIGLRFPTVAAFVAWLEDVDRAMAQYTAENVDQYHSKVQALRTELHAVRGTS